MSAPGAPQIPGPVSAGLWRSPALPHSSGPRVSAGPSPLPGLQPGLIPPPSAPAGVLSVCVLAPGLSLEPQSLSSDHITDGHFEFYASVLLFFI